MPEPDDKKKTDDKDKPFSRDEIQKSMQYILGEVKKVADSVAAINVVRDKKGDDKSDPDDKKGPAKDKDLEDMDRSEFADHLITKMAEVIKPLQTGVEEALRGVKSTTAKGEIERLETEHPEFWKFSEEMKELQKDYPNASVDDLFTLAKGRNPDKVQEIKAKAKEDTEKKAKDDKKKEPEFSGFMPTSGKSVDDDTMSATDAAAKAFDESGVPEALVASSDGP